MRNIVFYCLALMAISAYCQKAPGFGESFDPANAIPVEELLSRLEVSGEVSEVVVTGEVVEVCQVKGCWMTLKTGEDNDMRVTFRDYGFFVPKDIHGKTVIIKGSGEVTVTSVDDLRHYAEDEGQSEEEIAAIIEPLEEYVFVADGVMLVE